MDFYLNDKQRILVTEHLDVVDKVIRKCIHINSQICGMEYDDIYQVGAIGLCKAATTYHEFSTAKFDTYAFKVVKNTILDHLKKIIRNYNSQEMHMYELVNDLTRKNSVSPENILYEDMIVRTLKYAKVKCSGSTLKGIEAIELRLQGFSSKEIAKKYSVPTNYITACVSRAKKYLQKNELLLDIVA